MPIKTIFVDADHVRTASQPNHGGRYALIPHGTIIDEARQHLAQAGLDIAEETYKTTLDGQVAQGIYKLKHSADPEMGLMFAWSNSYNKMMRFKCAIGGQVFVCANGVVSGDLGNYHRKHSGSALHDVKIHIMDQISKAHQYYTDLIDTKEHLKTVMLTKKAKAEILGTLYAEQEILTLTQVGIVKREMDKPSFEYGNVDPDSAWMMYNHITHALKDSHPLHYLTDHQKVHTMFVDQFGQLTQPAVLQPIEEELTQEDYEMDCPAVDHNVFGVNFL